MKKTILLTSLLALLASCHKDENKDQPDPEPQLAERTVLVYVAGDNDLTGMGSSYSTDYFKEDLEQMMQGTHTLDTNNKLILFVDHSKEKPYFMQVELGDTIRLKNMETEMKSSDPETLYEAMKYVTDNYAAKSYGLVLWGHANGWITRDETRAGETDTPRLAPRRAYGGDYTGGRTWMNIPEMARALERLPRLKFIFADCCCFMCVEDVYELRATADYIIGSAAEIPGEGAPYHTIVPAMFSQDSTYYEQIVDRYYEQRSGNYQVPLAAVRTSELENLAKATATTMASFAADIAPDDDGCRYPSTSGLIFYYNHTQFDMQDFMLRYASADQYAEWKRVFDKAVPKSTYADVWMANHVVYSNRYEFYDFTPTEEREGGLGMFLPQKESDEMRWNVMYRMNLSAIGADMNFLNNHIKDMQWYSDAKLSQMGW